ncbi:MAG: ACT domain-containing protein [Phycisphaerae bacterium]
MTNNNHTLRTDTQLSVFLVNKPGVLARVCQQLADSKINIVGMSMMDSTEHGVLRMVVEEPQRARGMLTHLDVPTTETQVLVATLPNRPGALADMVERLAAAHINVNYAYCTTGAPGGKTLGIFKVTDNQKAMHVLEERKPRRKEPLAAVRAEPRARRR